MARRIEHRTRSGWNPKTVYRALIDPGYLTERLAALGGPGASLVEHAPTGDEVRYRLRHGVASGDLPAPIRTLLGGDLTIDRAETWRPDGDDGYAGTVKVTIPGMPGDLSGTMRLTATDDGGSEHLVDGTVRVPIPLVGGRVEESVVDQLSRLLDAEDRFTQTWLREHQS